MALDLIFLAMLVIFMIRGYRKGIVLAVCSLLAIILAVMGALKLSGTVARLLFADNNGVIAKWAPMVTYLLLFVLIVWGVRLLASFIERSLKIVMLGWANKLSGAIVYGLIVCFVWSTFLWLGNKISLVNPRTKEASVTYSHIEPLAPLLFSGIGKVWPFARSVFNDLSNFYDKLNKDISGDVGAD